MGNDKHLTLIIDLVNRTEKGFKKMYDDLEATERRIENTSRYMKEMGAVGTAAFAGLSYGIGRAIQEAGNAEKIAANFENTFGESGDVIKSFINDFGDEFAFVKSEMMDGANSIGFQLNAMGGIGEEQGQEITKSLLTASGALSDFFGEQINVTQASNAMAKGLAGNRQQLIDMGFNVLQEDIEDAAAAMGMNTKELTKSQEAMVFTKLIMEQTQGSQEGLNSTMDTYTGQVRAMRKASIETAQTLGEVFVPMATEVLKTIQPIINSISRWIQENPTLAKNITLVALSVTGLMAAMLPLGFLLPRIITSYKLLRGAGGYLITSLKGVATAITVVSASMKSFMVAIVSKTTYVKLASTATKVYTATQLALSKSFKAASFSALTFSKVMKGLKYTIAATGLGALVIVIGMIVSKFMELSDTVGGMGNAFKMFWAEFKVQALNAMQTVLEGIAKVINYIPGVDDALKDSIETMEWLKDAAKEDSDDIAMSIMKTKDASKETAESMDIDASKIQGMFDDISAGASGASDETNDFFESLKQSVSSIRDEIRNVYDDMTKATEDFQKKVGDENQSYEGRVVDMVAKATEEKKQLEKELKAAKKADDEEEVERLRQKIDEQEDIIESYHDLEIDLDEEVAEKRKYLRMNELEQLQADHERKIQMIKKEHLQEQVERLKRLVNLEQEQKSVMNMTDEQTQHRINAELEKTRTVREQLELQKQGVRSWVGETKLMYQNYVSDSNSIFSGLRVPSGTGLSSSFNLTGSRVQGGKVSPSGTYLVGERGPELFSPDTYGRISANRGSGVIVQMNFTGNHFTDENYERKIREKIEKDLKRNIRFSLS